ncbi:MAG: ABC-type uncharacterized transport system auxiliary subunit [Lysobacterales bacterium]|jgi:ABC-type uncharacterized transport system auxiliary subunit
MKYQFRFSVLMTLITASFLTMSCSGLLSSDKPADKIYWLEPYSASPSKSASDDRPGLEIVFTVVPGLDSDLLLTIKSDSELNHYSGARWPDHLPEFTGSLLRRSLQQSGLFRGVTDGRSSDIGECELELELQKFYTRIDQSDLASSVQMSLVGQYDCDDMSLNLNLTSATSVQGQQLVNIVAAHQSGWNKLMKSLLLELE